MTESLGFDDEMYFEYCKASEMSITESTLWHFTGISGLLGITKNSDELAFWFTNKDYLNDSSEGQSIKNGRLEMTKRDMCLSI